MSITFNKFVERKYKVQLLEYLVKFVQYHNNGFVLLPEVPNEITFAPGFVPRIENDTVALGAN